MIFQIIVLMIQTLALINFGINSCRICKLEVRAFLIRSCAVPELEVFLLRIDFLTYTATLGSCHF